MMHGHEKSDVLSPEPRDRLDPRYLKARSRAAARTATRSRPCAGRCEDELVPHHQR
jgi:hypothetical protein